MKQSVVTVTFNPAIDKTVTVQGLQPGGLNRVRDVRTDPGGKGINVAKVLRGFDADVIATGFVAGNQGRQLTGQLDAAGIEHRFVEVAGDTRTNLKIYDEESKVTTEVNEPGFNVQAQDVERFLTLLEDLLAQASFLVLGGSLPPGVPDDIYHTLIEAANRHNVRTILDADANALKKGLEAIPYAIKPNLYELEQLTGRTLTTQDEIVGAGRELLARGVSLVVISMGGDGSIVLQGEEAYQVKPYPITPLSTVGAGDSMVAALVHATLQGKSVQEMAEFATTAGTITASKSGTQVCTLSEVNERVALVHAVRM